MARSYWLVPLSDWARSTDWGALVDDDSLSEVGALSTDGSLLQVGPLSRYGSLNELGALDAWGSLLLVLSTHLTRSTGLVHSRI
jgi:hypothetical protein